MLKKKLVWDLPSHIGFFVYQYAKLRMLEFYYDFLDKYLDRSDFQLCEMDTDSLYLSLSTPTLEEAVRPHLLTDFYSNYHHWFPSDVCDGHRDDFVTGKTFDCQACRTRKLYDKRTPGLFKLEYEGEGMISLCSKTYFCQGLTTKTSTKGLNKRQNDLTYHKFKEVLDTRQAGGGENMGFRTIDNSVYTYTQHRNALTYFYIKRLVHSDGYTTSPLAI